MSASFDPDITLVLSGHVYRSSLLPFWRGFIELQRSMPSNAHIKQTLTHSWNPEYDELVDLVYAPEQKRSEVQTSSLSRQMLFKIKPPDLFERNLVRESSTWKNVSIQAVLGNGFSRAYAASLMNKVPDHQKGGRVLITRWDLGQSGSAQVNRLVVDFSLPTDYGYYSYFSEVDEGYADMWIVAPWDMARRFETFGDFIVQSLSGNNAFLSLFTEKGWPRSRARTRIEEWVSHPIVQALQAKGLKLVKAVQARSQGRGILNRVLRRLSNDCARLLELPPLTAENSCIPESKGSNLRIFPDYLALNIHALLKFFVLSEGMREKTRFLTADDFHLGAMSGKLINPQACSLFIDVSDMANKRDGEAIAELFARSPLPLYRVFLFDDERLDIYCQEDQGATVLSHSKVGSAHSLGKSLDAISAEIGDDMPLLHLTSLESFTSCQDWPYLNALLKHMIWSGTDYICLTSEGDGKDQADFPDLQTKRGQGAFSSSQFVSNVGCLRSLLTKEGRTLDDVSRIAEAMKLEFVGLAANRRLFNA